MIGGGCHSKVYLYTYVNDFMEYFMNAREYWFLMEGELLGNFH